MSGDTATRGDPVRVDLDLPERLDATTAPHLRDALAIALDAAPGAEVVVAASAVRVVDSVGLGVLVTAHRNVRRTGGRLVLVDPSPGMIRLLALTRLNRVLYVERDPRIGRTAAAQ